MTKTYSLGILLSHISKSYHLVTHTIPMKTTIGITTDLLKQIEKNSKELSFKFKGEGVTFLLRNALRHIRKRGYDSFLMKNEEVQLTAPMDIPKEKIQKIDPAWRIYKESLKSPLYKNPLVWRLWMYCLDKAVSVKKLIYINSSTSVTLEVGSFLSSNAKTSEETGLTDKNYRVGIKLLTEEKMIETAMHQSRAVGTVIKIVGW